MAISTDAAIEFFGTQTSVVTSTAAVTDGSFSAQEDTFTNSDDAPQASAVLVVTFGSAPDDNSFVALYARLLNIDGLGDQDTPDAEFLHTFLGNFPVDNTTSSQNVAIDIVLPNTKSSQEYEFYIQNRAGETISSGWELFITPKTLGPHA